MTRNTLLCSALALSGLSALSGCTQPLNDRLTLGGSYISPTFRSPEQTSTPHPEDVSAGVLFSSAKPRSAWAPMQYISPYDGVVHSPLLRVLPPHKHTDTPRNYGLYPTLGDAPFSQTLPYLENLARSLKGLGRTVLGTPLALAEFISSGQIAAPSDAPARVWKRTKQGGWSTGYPTDTKPPEPTTAPEGNKNDHQ